MKKLFLAIFLCSFFINSNAQKANILYYMPDSVEVLINEHISSQKSNSNFYFILESIGKDTFRINVCQYFNKEKKRVEDWIFSTKRKVVINRNSYPLLLDYDYMFSTLNPLRVGYYGDRANKIVRQLPIIHCFSIKFTKFYILSNANKPIQYANKQIGE